MSILPFLDSWTQNICMYAYSHSSLPQPAKGCTRVSEGRGQLQPPSLPLSGIHGTKDVECTIARYISSLFLSLGLLYPNLSLPFKYCRAAWLFHSYFSWLSLFFALSPRMLLDHLEQPNIYSRQILLPTLGYRLVVLSTKRQRKRKDEDSGHYNIPILRKARSPSRNQILIPRKKWTGNRLGSYSISPSEQHCTYVYCRYLFLFYFCFKIFLGWECNNTPQRDLDVFALSLSHYVVISYKAYSLLVLLMLSSSIVVDVDWYLYSISTSSFNKIFLKFHFKKRVMFNIDM